MLISKQKPQCFWTKTEGDRELEGMVGYPEVEKVYKPLEKSCKSIAAKRVAKSKIIDSNPNIILWVFVAIIIVNILIIYIIIVFVFKKKYVIQFKRFP
jgi:hypothetical protein